MRIKIRRLDTTLPLPAYATKDAAGFDLAAAHDITVPTGAIALVRQFRDRGPRTLSGIFARSSTPPSGIVAMGRRSHYSGPNDEIMIQVLNVSGADVW
jgi:dUTPase